jgi:hypothetical protein
MIAQQGWPTENDAILCRIPDRDEIGKIGAARLGDGQYCCGERNGDASTY